MARRSDPPPGALAILIVNTFAHAPFDGYRIALSIKRRSGYILTLEEGSLDSTLQRLPAEGWVKEEGKTTETSRRTRSTPSPPQAVSKWASSYHNSNRGLQPLVVDSPMHRRHKWA